MIGPSNEEELRAAVRSYKESLLRRTDPYTRLDQLEAYLNKWSINDVVVGISGGVDSALVLAMLSQIPGIRIHAVVITFDMYGKVFDYSYIETLKERFKAPKVHWVDSDLSLAHTRFMLSNGLGNEAAEVDANVSYAMRYLAFFAFAQTTGGITIGTTNRDEMGYSGWFGKTSDMMVDVQPISDLHKFEVIEWARKLGVPQSILDRTPTGDLIDGSSDEENFGCTYDELSFFTDLKAEGSGCKLTPFLEKRFEKLIALHERNAHKYQGQGFNPVFLTG